MPEIADLLAAAPAWLGPTIIVAAAGLWAYAGVLMLRTHWKPPARHRAQPAVRLAERHNSPTLVLTAAREPETAQEPPHAAAVRVPALPVLVGVQPTRAQAVAAHAGATEDWSPTAELARVEPSDWTDADWQRRRDREDHAALNRVEDQTMAAIGDLYGWVLDALGVDGATRLELAREEDLVRAGDTEQWDAGELRELLAAEEEARVR